MDCFDFSAAQAFLNDAQARLTLMPGMCRSIGRVVGWFQVSFLGSFCTAGAQPKAFAHQVQKALGVPVGLAWRPCNLQVDSAHLV